jgi:hypothetical protein
LRELVVCFSESGIDLDGVLKFDCGFAVLTALEIGFTPGEVLLL